MALKSYSLHGEEEATMARRILKRVTMLMLLLTMALVTAVATANGQSQHRVNASVPFEFIVGDKTLAAADYRIDTVGEALAIRSAGAKNNVIRLANAMTPKESKPARLVFHRYGNTYFLSEVWEGGDRIGRRLVESRQERAMRSELSRMATNKTTSYEEVAILATVR
jgi:hypothetical protein